MTVGATIGHGVSLLDPALPAVSRKRVDPFEPQTPPPPAEVGAAPAVAPPRTGGLLSSDSIAEVLKLTDSAPADAETVRKPFISRQDLADAARRSRAYAAGDNSEAGGLNGLAGRYTQKDVGLIRATTGYNVVTVGGLSTIVDDEGNPPPAELSDQVWRMADGIELARLGGMKGEITLDYLKEMFATYMENNTTFPDDWLDKARNFMGGTAA